MNEMIRGSRKSFDDMGLNYPAHKSVIIEKQPMEDVPGYWFYPNGNKNVNHLILYLHGGCFIFGSLLSHQPMVSHLCATLELPVFFPEYRLAPEYPYPQGLMDSLSVYERLSKTHPKSDILLMGDSAGAALAVELCGLIHDKALRFPEATILVSPWMDFTCSLPSNSENAAIDPILSKERLQELIPLYYGKKDAADVNLINKTIDHLPPMLIQVGSNEILLDDARWIYEKAKSCQPMVTLSIYDQQTHVWPLDDVHTEATKNAFGEIKDFIDQLTTK